MGQTLENGVYLPSEGERNCYAGLKTNWEILDQKVADVTALQQAVAGALHREIVASLPTTDIDPNTIYMILSGTSATENVYNEYMYVNNAWELIGTSATDLTNYYTKAEVDGKLLLKANASDLTSHTGDTTIHVTTADKNKWNNQTYVFRYSSTALVASSTNSNTLLDNTDNLKVGDKVIDSNGVLFSVTAIDTENSTFTIGTALIDLAQDSDVVHTSGDETISGNKTFNGSTTCVGELNQTAPFKMTADTSFVTGNKNNSIYDQNGFQCADDQILYNNNKNIRRGWIVKNNNSGTTVSAGFYFNLNASGQKVFYPISDSDTDSGSITAYWKNTYTKRLNGLNPSSLGMPDISQGIDISSYITNLSKSLNTYTPTVNGWIEIELGRSALPKISMRCRQTDGLIYSTETSEFSSWGISFPVIGGKGVSIYLYADSLNKAKFYPCLGNV